jgi:hypothetical protein
MINQDERHNHWQVLAEQLGLEPETPAESTPAVREVATPKARPHHVPEHKQMKSAEFPVDEETSFSRGRHHDAPAPVEAPVEAETPDASPEAEDDTGRGDDDLEKPRGSEGRGRRRRRRGSKAPNKNEASESTDTPTEATDANAPPEKDDARRGRGRGRPRSESPKPAPRRVEPVAEDDEAPAAKAAPATEDDDVMDDLSNWQAPSWQELIASLYRPER